MNCPYCGNTLEENQQFCSYCGYQISNMNQQMQGYSEQQPYQQQNYQQPPYQQPQYQHPYYQQVNMPYNQAGGVNPKKKSKAGLIIGIMAIIVVCSAITAVCFSILAPFIQEDNDTESSYSSNQSDDDDSQAYSDDTDDSNSEADNNDTEANNNTQTDDENSANASSSQVNSEYAEVFSSRNIVEPPSSFVMLQSESFVYVDESFGIEKVEYGYDGDTVEAMVSTIYVSIADYTEQQKNELDTLMKEAYSVYEKLDFCTVSYSDEGDYYVIITDFEELDNLENVYALSDAGDMLDSGDSLISMKKTEKNLLSSGYIKK